MEIAVAALIPPAFLVLLSSARWFPSDLRRAVRVWFVPFTLLWLAPCWLSGRSLAPFDIVVTQFAPWQSAFPGVQPGNLLLSDVVLQFVPWREAVSAAWMRGELPFIDPSAGAGAALWANPQAAVLHPLTILGVLFSAFAWPVFVASAKFLIASTGTYLFLRNEGTSHTAAVLGGVGYAFGAFSVAFLLFPHTNVTGLLPWLLLAIVRCGGERGAPVAVAGALIVVAMASGGHPESMLHSLLVAAPVAARTLWRCAPARRRSVVVRLGSTAGIGLLLSCPLLVPFMQTLPSMQRLADLERRPQLAAAPEPSRLNLSAFVAPALLDSRDEPSWHQNFNETATQYVGLGALVLALVAVTAAPRRRAFWWVLAVGLLPLAFRFELIDRLLAGVPLLGGALHGRVRFVLGFITAVLAAWGWDELSSRARPARWLAALMVGTAVASAFGFWGRPNVAVSVGVASVSVLALLAAHTRERLACLAPAILFADLAALMLAYHPPTPRAHFYPLTEALEVVRRESQGDRIVAVGQTLPANTAAMHGLRDIAVHDPTAFEPYVSYLESGGYDRRRYLQSFPSVPPQSMLDLLGVKLILGPPGMRSEALPAIYRGPDAVVLLNRTAFPPVRVLRGDATLQVQQRGANRLDVEVTSAGGASLSTTVVNLQGWKLRRDGQAWRIEPRAGTLIGWAAPPGKHRFSLRYTPPGLGDGVLMAGLGVLLLVLLWRSDRARGSI